MKKLFAGMSAVAISLTQMGTVFAAYSDVAAGVWYEDAVDAFTDAGYLDASQTRFRGGDNANRAEFIKLVVELNGGILSTAPAVPSFDDVKAGAWYYGYMEEAAKEGWVKGDNNCYGSKPCNARPAANINRAEAAALIVRAFGLDGTGDAPSFVDVPNGQWYTEPVQTAADYCVLQGDDATGRARPADFMNRAEMVVMLHRVDMGLTYGVDCEMGEEVDPMITDVTATSATTVEVEFSVALDETAAVDADLYMVSGAADLNVTSVDWIDESTVELTLDDSTDAGEDYTLSVEDMETEDGETFSDSMDFAGYTEIVQGDGVLEVSLASTNPSADTVPQGAVGVVMLSADLTASCDDAVVISELTVLHEGFGEESDITGVYAAMDGARLTRERSINSQDQVATLRFQEPLTIAACRTETIDIVADFDTGLTSGAEHNFAIELPSDFQSNARDVEGNFPVRGNTFRLAAVSVGEIEFTYRSVTPSTTEVGEEGEVLGKFELDADSTEDQTVYSITMEQNGGVSDGDVANLKIRRTDGTVLTNTVATTTSDYATFVFDPPFTILEGNSITLEIVGDVIGGAGETVSFDLEEESDLFAVGSLYGYGVNGQLYGSRVQINAGAAASVSIDAGQLTIEIDGPTQQAYSVDEDNAVLANVDIVAGQEPVDIQDMYLAIRAQGSGGLAIASTDIDEMVTDVELYNTRSGTSISASEVGDASATGGFGAFIYRLDDFLVSGDTSWEVRVDFNEVAAGPDTGSLFRVDICASDTACGGVFSSTQVITAEGESTGDDVTDIRPDAIVVGNSHRIATPGLTVTVESTGASDTAVRNSKNINLLRFTARAEEGEDVLLTSLAFDEAAGSLLNAQNYALWVDTDGDTVVDTILESGVASETTGVSFSDLAGGGYVVPAEETVVFEVHADVASSLTGSPATLRLRFNDGDADDIEAEEVDNGSSIEDITLNQSNSAKLFTFIDGGNLFVTKDGQSVRSRQLLGGTLADEVLRLNFRSQDEQVEVTDIRVATSGSLVAAQSIERLDLYKAGETTSFASATIGGCASGETLGNSADELTFCAKVAANKLVVTSTDIDVLVRPRVKTDVNGARSSSGITFWTGSGGIEARGLASSTDYDINDGSSATGGEVVIGSNSAASANTQIAGNQNMVVLSKITSIVNAGAADGLVPSGTTNIGQFRFTAATNTNTQNGTNKAVLSGVIFTVSATNVDIDSGSFQIYNTADPSTKKACSVVSALNASGSLKVRCDGLVAHAVNTEIDSGASATFALEANVTNTQVATGNSSLQVSMQDFTDVDDLNFGTTTSTMNSVHWLDTDTATRSFFWFEYADTVINSTSFRN